MNSFLAALQFLTIIPIRANKAVDEKKLASSTAYFPIVGLLLGLILVAANKFFLLISLEPFLTNVILVISLIILTGGLHLDGLADTFDALSSRKSKSEMLTIMRDSRVGTMGALSLISIILLKLSLLSSLGPGIKNASLLLMCLLSRYALVFSIFFFPYAREEGKARIFKEGMNPRIFSVATLSSLGFSAAILGLRGIVVFIAAAAFAFLAGKFISNKIGGLTGDNLGAVNELTEVLVLLTILILT